MLYRVALRPTQRFGRLLIALSVGAAITAAALAGAAGGTRPSGRGWTSREALVRVSLQSESSGLLFGDKYISQAKVLEVLEFDGVRVGDEGLVVTYVGSATHDLNLDAVRATLRTLDGLQGPAQVLGLDERLSLLFLRSDSEQAGLQLSPDTEIRHFNLAKIVDNRLFLASACVQGRSRSSWLPSENLVVSGLSLVGAGWRGATSVDLKGRLLGIVTAAQAHQASNKLVNCELLPARLILDSLDQIQGGKRRIPAGWLGVFLEQEESTIRILGVVEGGPAEQVGLQAGDEILELDGRRFADVAELARAISWKGPGSESGLTIQREGSVRRLTATLGPRRHRHKSGWKMDVLPRLGSREPGRAGVQVYRTPLPPLLDLGLHVDSLPPQLARKFKSPTGGGLLVTEVVESSAAQKAGFQAGDVLFRVNGKDIFSISDIERCLEGAESAVLEIQMVRDGTRLYRKLGL